jgi:hypothetical protein
MMWWWREVGVRQEEGGECKDMENGNERSRMEELGW